MGGHERPSVLLPVNLSDLSISSFSFERPYVARKIEYNTTRYLALIFRKIDFTDSFYRKEVLIYLLYARNRKMY